MDNQTAKYAIGTGATGVGANGPADAAEDNRRSLRAAGVFCVSLFGGPGLRENDPP